MAEKRKGKKRKEDVGEEESKASKDEFKVAKWLKNNVPVKKTKFLYHNVEYFTGSKAVDALMSNSPWASTLFQTRPDVVDFLDTMLRHKFFHRALKVPISEEELQAKKRRKKGDKDKEKEKEKESDAKEDAESSHAEGKTDDPSASPKATKDRKKKRKIRLEMHLNQCFEDGLDAYVWLYDPIPFHYWVFGTLMVLGSIGICLFPLWPPEVRKGVYYLSIAGAGFLCLIITLAVIRLIVFFLVWVFSLGRHHFWFLPNLTEDVGFFASFWPLYQYEYKGDTKSEKGKKKKKAKDSDDEQEDDKQEESNDKDAEGDGEGTIPDQPLEGDERVSRSESESESSSQKSQTGKDFEIVDKDEVEDT